MLMGNSISAQSTFRCDYTDSIGNGNFRTVISDSSGFLIAGSRLVGNNVQVGIIMKTDLDGRILWTKNIGDTTTRISINSSTKLFDGTYLIAAYDQILQKCHFYNLDTLGNIIWQKQIQNNGVLSFVEAKETKIVLAGNTASGFALLIIDSLLNNIWGKVYGLNNSRTTFQVSSSHDNGFLFLYDHSTFDTCSVMKTDSAGNFLWAKVLNSNLNTLMSESINGDLLFVSSWASSSTQYGIRVVKLDEAGNLLWSEDLVGLTNRENPYSVISTSDGGCLILGRSRNAMPGWATLVVKIYSNGNIAWSEILGSYSDIVSYPFQIINTIDNAYGLICNKTQGTVFFKMDSLGFAGCAGTPYPMTVTSISGVTIVDDSISVDTTSVQFVPISLSGDTSGLYFNQTCFLNKIEDFPLNTLTVFPIPCKDELVISETISHGRIKVFDLTGKICIEIKSELNETKLNTSFLERGFYLISYEEDGKIRFAKAVKSY